MLLLLLYILWLVLNARLSMDVLLTGVPVCLLIWLFSLKYLHFSLKKEIRLLRRVPAVCAFFFFLLWDVLGSALKVIARIWSFRRPSAELLHLDPGLRTGAGRVLWASAVTLTPGTITVDLAPGECKVHTLDAPLGKDIESAPMLRRVRALEGDETHG